MKEDVGEDELGPPNLAALSSGFLTAADTQMFGMRSAGRDSAMLVRSGQAGYGTGRGLADFG